MEKPKIRFKGYNDAWEQRKLGEVFEEYAEKNHPELPALTIIQGGGTVRRDESERNILYDKDNLSGYKLVRKNDFIMHLRSFEGGLEKATSDGVISPAYHTFHGVEADARFYYAYFRSYDFIKIKLVPHIYGIRDGKSIDVEGMKSIRIPYPSFAEQKKIGDYIDTLDKLITFYRYKCDETKTLKKYMLQKMFPKDGEKVPEIRFSGFTDAWEQRKFSDCYRMSSGYAFKMSDYCDGGIGLINGESIQHGIINDDNLNHLPESFIQQYPDFVLKEGDIVVGLNRPITNGNLKIARIPSKYNDSLLYQRAGKIVYKENCDKNFSYVLLSQEILKHTLVEAVGSDQPFISTSKLDKWQMMIPSNIEEQKKIGNYFRNLDHLITLHQRKCEELQNIKKFMLQNMLI